VQKCPTSHASETRSIHLHGVGIVARNGRVVETQALVLAMPMARLDDGLADAVLGLGDGERLGLAIEHNLHAGELAVRVGEHVRGDAVVAEVLLNVREEDELALVVGVGLVCELVVDAVDIDLVLGVLDLHRVVGVAAGSRQGSRPGGNGGRSGGGGCGCLDGDVEFGAGLFWGRVSKWLVATKARGKSKQDKGWARTGWGRDASVRTRTGLHQRNGEGRQRRGQTYLN
jgi:hypothetical protein